MIDGTWEPAPATRWEDAFLSGNGHHGAMVYGDPGDDRVIVDHHTLVRPNGSENVRPPELADGLGRLQDALLAGDVTAAEGFGAGHPLVWVQPFHPAFQTRVRRDRGLHEAVAGYRREVDFTTGEVTASYEAWRSRVFVSRADDVIVQHITDLGLSAHLFLDHALPGAPAQLAVGRTTVLTPEGANLALRIGYPGSDVAYTGVTVARVDGGTVHVADEGIRVEGARSLTLTTRVRRGAGGHPDLAALWAALPHEDYDALLSRHRPLHRTAYGRTTLTLREAARERDLPGSALLRTPKSPALLERLFAAGRYHLLSSSGLLPPRLTGLWTGDWETAWSGAFTTNANLNLQIASAASAALPEVTEAHAALVHGQLADWQDNARALFGARGIVAPSHTDGESGHTRHFQRAYPLHLWTAGADWLLQPLLEHAEVTTGTPDPRLTAALVEVALFYEDFLTREDPDGRVAVVPSYSPENRPANASWGTVNATMDIAAARHALTTAAAHAPGHPSAGRWRALADRLPDHLVNEDGALAEWAWPGLAETYDHRHLSHLYPVWPLDEINPYDTPQPARAAHRALELRGSENDSAHGHLHHALIAARLRDPARVSAALDAVLGGDFFHDSLMSAHYPSRNVYNADAAHALPAAVIEALVQSTPGRLVLLPALPAACPAGELRGLRTRFGAGLDLSWSDGGATAVLRPTRDARVDLRTGDGHTLTETPAGDPPAPLELTAGVDRVLTLGPR
ncbi:glycoside hydrolase N-terminal domain-containing protein [Streptomyces sp. B1I3]|uniref:glycosyl hydrolase family 95 catalytic domain-containing protein n=1 Tax=Streptomyces sp. B1I3 TaxID=3042264 RepID=UPI002783AB1B|nr:glycoside hydrolase N-terminal domain-containing protein [Streptomyces sp. B1I3]MDQ0792804.1 alpha-L-fucosidase 2 [Streptomyces sp. B1I3]